MELPPRRAFAGIALFVALTSHGAGAEAPTIPGGPDLTVITLDGVSSFGGSGGFHAYSLGTTACNRGTQPLTWCDQVSGCPPGATTHDHPVIAQNMYRLKGGRFEQIGMSWLKHGFASANSPHATCTGATGGSCAQPPFGENQLGVGCVDPYASGQNGTRPLGMRSEVNATNGVYPFPYTGVAASTVYDQRIKVADADLEPAQNAGALYWVEAQYVAPDDARAGYGLNNASYAPATVGSVPNPLTVSQAGATIEAKSALYAWKAQDAAVSITNVDMCHLPVERFEVARRATELVPGTTWHYEYAVRNMNSDHAGGAFEVRFAEGTAIANGGGRTIDHHSGEPYSTNPWTMTVDSEAGYIRWQTDDPWETDPDANALRWGTTFNFWFDADAPPAEAVHTVEPFRVPAGLVADAGADTTLCRGDSTQIGTAAVPGLAYLWQPGGLTTARITVSPNATTTYTLTVSNGCDQLQDTIQVAVDPGPAAPALLSPSNGAGGLHLPVVLDWSASPGASAYAVEVATDAGVTDVVIDQETDSPGYEIDALSAGRYYWRARARNSCPGPNSTTFSFSVVEPIFSDGFASGDTLQWSQDFR